MYNYITSQISQTGQDSINVSELAKQFVESGVMSKDTLYKSLGKLIGENKIDKPMKKGKYSLAKNEEDGRDIQSN